MMTDIQPTKAQLVHWIDNYVPEKDVYFIEAQDLNVFDPYLTGALVMPRKEYFQHPSYNTIQLINSFTYWRISKTVEYVIVAPPSWITGLPKLVRRALLAIQVKVCRGLIFPLSVFSTAEVVPQEYILEDNSEQAVVIQRDMWEKLPHAIKEHVIKGYAQLWDRWTCLEIPEQTPDHIRRYANSFSVISGSNCLATALFAITEEDWIVHEWMHPDTFEHGLKRANYVLVEDEIRETDVAVWVNADHVIVHGSYHIGNKLFFNKEGQTYFNPWKIVHLDELLNEWQPYKMRVYRKIPDMILHIIRKTDWEKTLSQGYYAPDSIEKEGFIHCSTAEQVVDVANLLYRGERDLVLLVIDPQKVETKIVFEDLYETNKLFPHIYGQLNLDAVVNVVEFAPKDDGTFEDLNPTLTVGLIRK